MTRQDLEHIIRAAADVTQQQHLIIIGSQAILGQYPNAPEALLVSMEADLYAPDAPELSDFIDGALGPDTLFDKTHGYHADGVSPTTASLPAGWSGRLTPICNPNTNGATGWCIEVHRGARYRHREVRGRARERPALHERSLDTRNARPRNTR